jgi:hypothetical protein
MSSLSVVGKRGVELGKTWGLGANCSGAAAVMLALSLGSILGLAGLGTEVASWYFQQ